MPLVPTRRAFTALAAHTVETFPKNFRRVSAAVHVAATSAGARAADIAEGLASECRAQVQTTSEVFGLWLLQNVAQVKVDLRREVASTSDVIGGGNAKPEQADSDNVNANLCAVPHISADLHSVPHENCLGVFLGTYGPKHLYSTSVQALADVDIWENQRTFCPNRASELARAKQSTLGSVGFPGSITVVTAHDGSSAVCVDGQHRLAALTQLVNEGILEADTPAVIEVFSAPKGASPSQRNVLASAVFTDINSCEPVKLCDIPGAMEAEEKAVLDAACLALKEKFPSMFKPTSKCRPPHVHLDTLRDKLFHFNVIRQLQTGDAGDLEGWLLEQNNFVLSKIKEDRWLAMRGRSGKPAVKNALAKAKKNKFWMGMPGALAVIFDTK